VRGLPDARKARRVLSVVGRGGVANPATVPHCGECDETRHRETPFGVIRCPECHPRAEEASWGEDIPRPSVSSEWARRQAKEAAAAAVRAAKDARKKPAEETTT
jgi:ribosomal protein L37AE/L43A